MNLSSWVGSLKDSSKPSLSVAISFLGDLFPLLHKYEETPQDVVRCSKESVYIRTQKILEELYKIFDSKEFTISSSERLVLILSAIFHDYGKSLMAKKTEDHIRSLRYEQIGMNLLVFPLLKLNLEQKEYLSILSLVGYHQRPELAVVKKEPDSKFYELAAIFDYRLMYILELANIRSCTCEDKEVSLLYLEEFYNKTKYLLDKTKLEKSFISMNSIVESKVSHYLLNKGKISSILEAPQATYSMLLPENYFKFVLMVGVPASGKSTFIQEHFIKNAYDKEKYTVISMDQIREEIGKGRWDQSKNKEVALLAKERLKECLRKKQSVIWDATNIRKEHREQLLSLAEDYGATTQMVVLLEKESIIKKRDSERKHQVSVSVIDKMIKNFEFPSKTEAMITHYFVNTEVIENG